MEKLIKNRELPTAGPIGIFDSGYGGLTVYRAISKLLPQYDYLYLGDNARAPYGTRSFQTIYEYTWHCVQELFRRGCRLVILACNTASAKALRSIQQEKLPHYPDDRKVLGVLRPTTEQVGRFTQANRLGIMATQGTVSSLSYPTEISRFFPKVEVYQQPCPLWVPLVEYGEFESSGADFFVEQYLNSLLGQCSEIDALLLACTHYPLLIPKIKMYLPQYIQVIEQGPLVAERLQDYLTRHPEIEILCAKNRQESFLTTDSPEMFAEKASVFMGRQVDASYWHGDRS